MGKKGLKKDLAIILIAVVTLMAMFLSPADAVSVNPNFNANFLYKLSDFTGIIPYMGGKVRIDQDRNETYVLYQHTVKVFNEKGMEIYRFGDSENLGRVHDLAIDHEGNILVLTEIGQGSDLDTVIIRCNFKGDPLERIAIKGIPQDFKEFRPGSMVYRDGQIYLVDGSNLRVAIIDVNGQVRKTIDLVPLSELREQDRGDVQLGGFSVDASGNMLFTLPVLFSATVLSPDGKVATFGEPGSLPGKFGVVADIMRDNRGNIFVADRLKSIVSVYDSSFKFMAEFGGRGNDPGSLVVPQEIAIGADDRLYVTQLANRGVSVFRLYYNK